MNNKPETKYCSYCGKKMLVWNERADKCMMFYGDQSTIPIADRYDKKTGKENYVWKCKCPNYKKRKWYQIGGSPHDEYFLEEVFN
jgi:hypothetical protein